MTDINDNQSIDYTAIHPAEIIDFKQCKTKEELTKHFKYIYNLPKYWHMNINKEYVKRNIISQTIVDEINEAHNFADHTFNFDKLNEYLYRKYIRGIIASKDITKKEKEFINNKMEKLFNYPADIIISINKNIKLFPDVSINRILIGNCRKILDIDGVKTFIIFAFYINNKLVQKAFPLSGPNVNSALYDYEGSYGKTNEEAFNNFKKTVMVYINNYYTYKNNYHLINYYNENNYLQFIADKLIRALVENNIIDKISKIKD